MTTNKQKNFFLPAEWHKQSGIMLTWPHENTDWKPYLKDITDTYILMTKAIAKYEMVIIATPYVDDVRGILNGSLSEKEMDNVSIYNVDSNDTWARDHGPITLLAQDDDECVMLDFGFNAWGEKFESEKDNAINRQLYDKGVFNASIEDCNDFILEGGSIESDGCGTVFTTSSCLLAPHRNQPLEKDEIDKCLCAYFNAKRVVWLDYGTLIGDDTDGHIDTIVRIAPNDTLLYVGSGQKDDEQYNDFKALETQLKALKTIDGKDYTLMELPMPDAIYDDGERLPATYANFLILNGAVLVPVYNQEDNDRKALETIRKAFPDREIIGIDATTIIRQHGSIHCLTMQLPCGMLK